MTKIDDLPIVQKSNLDECVSLIKEIQRSIETTIQLKRCSYLRSNYDYALRHYKILCIEHITGISRNYIYGVIADIEENAPMLFDTFSVVEYLFDCARIGTLEKIEGYKQPGIFTNHKPQRYQYEAN